MHMDAAMMVHVADVLPALTMVLATLHLDGQAEEEILAVTTGLLNYSDVH